MSKKPRGLGRGLDALLPKTSGSSTRLPLASIKPNPQQPRRNFNQASLEELAASIRKQGLLQPLLVRPRGDVYELVAGERRYRAAQLAGLKEVPVIIRDLDDREALELALVENLQREDLNPVEEALGYQRLLEMGYSQAQIAEAVGKARSTVTNALRLLQLDEESRNALAEGSISAGHARALLMLPESQRPRLLRRIIKEKLSVRQAERLASRPQKPRRREAYPQLARDLERQLGLKVRFSGEKRGRLEIYYFSEEELQEILDLLGYQG
ncbi:ParB/RepB/Spo0J family partition protein [Oceanithermus sp.]